MHLDLTHGPFVPHNLISAQESPVPLPKFQMVPRLKISVSSGSKKGTQIYYPFPSKSPGKRIPSSFPNGAPMKRDACLQGIFTYLLIYPFISKALRREHPFKFPKSILNPTAHYRHHNSTPKFLTLGQTPLHYASRARHTLGSASCK